MKGKVHENALYKEIKLKIIYYIKEKKIKAHGLLPSESELSKTFHVSTMTSKLAFKSLEQDGIVYRIPRSGTFLSEKGYDEFTRNEDILIVDNTKLMALLLPSLDFYTAEILYRIEQELNERGINLIIKITSHNNILEESILAELFENSQILGILLFPCDRTFCGDTLIKMQLVNYPMVIIDTALNAPLIDSVCHNHFQGAYDITSYLITCGHRNIGFLVHRMYDSFSREQRYLGYLQALIENEIYINKNYILNIENEIDNKVMIENKYKEYIITNNNMTAVFCSDDTIAMKFSTQVLGLNKQIPKDISVVGFTDNKILESFSIKLTTVRQPVKRLAVEAVNCIFERLENKDAPVKTIKINTEIVERDSVASLL